MYGENFEKRISERERERAWINMYLWLPAVAPTTLKRWVRCNKKALGESPKIEWWCFTAFYRELTRELEISECTRWQINQATLVHTLVKTKDCPNQDFHIFKIKFIFCNKKKSNSSFLLKLISISKHFL